jgi:heterodisulfide reductase subunit A
MNSEKRGAMLVVGGGIAGIQAALDLAESGYYVYLVERSPAIGGVMAQLDKTFPTNDCSMCILSPKLVECGRHRNIETITYAEVSDIQGEPGRFKVSIRKRARSINESLCTGCGVCQEKCPWKTDSEFDAGLAKRKAIYILYPQAIPNIPVIDRELCAYFQKGTCRACEKFCPAHAIDFEQEDQFIEVEVGAVILCPGFDEFEPQAIANYGYGRYPNVVTSIEFERILSASGPYQGQLSRPSDKQTPGKIAWIQCVGSRDIVYGSGYCSSVCCTYAIKEAVVAKEHSAMPLDTAIFFMDMRTHGKGFERYYQRAEEEHKVRFIRSKIYSIEEVDGSRNLRIRYADEKGKVTWEEFDLVVLSVGLNAPSGAVDLAGKLGIELNKYGFCHTGDFSPVNASKPGIFVCGLFQGPKDIPETVMQASGAAAASSALLSPARNTMVKEKEYPPERDVTGEPPRIGAFICHCGINIGGVINVPEVTEYAASLPDVVFADENLYSCSQDTQERIKEKIKEHNLNRVVVASCTPRTHEPLFQETIREAGLNRYLFEMANIRDQCSWVHMEEKEAATQKAKELVRMAVAKARLLQPLKTFSLKVTPVALVAGGGISGMVSALSLAEQGFEVHLVEKNESLGGVARRIHHTLSGEDVQQYLAQLSQNVAQHPLIHVHTSSDIVDATGYVGNFSTKIAKGPEGKTEEIEHGVTIIATGAEEYKPSEYLYGEAPNVLTLLELEGEIAKGNGMVADSHNVVMIQCVGSRDEERPYCSRVCCGDAVKCALKLKEANPEINIYILYRDIRTYGFDEDYYQQARDKGVLFIRYGLDDKPVVERGEYGLKVSVTDPILGERLVIDADILALAAAMVPSEGNKHLSQLYKVPLNEDGFFLEAHMKLRPVDFATDGVFMCGLAHNPKSIKESIAQAQAAASRAATILAKEVILSEGIVAAIDAYACSGCQLCIHVCPYEAIAFDEEREVARVNELLCKGCGNCAAVCPSAACSLRGFEDKHILAQIEAFV